MVARPLPRPALGFSLIEVMVALVVLLVGLLGMLHLQIYGVTGNQGARATMTADNLARELAAGLERLDYADARLAVTGTAASAAPTGWGSLLSDASAATSWDDTKPIPGVRLDTEIESDDDGTPLYKRRWTTWGYLDGTTSAVVKIIAVSVVYHERRLRSAREVLLYVHKLDEQNVLPNLQAFR